MKLSHAQSTCSLFASSCRCQHLRSRAMRSRTAQHLVTACGLSVQLPASLDK